MKICIIIPTYNERDNIKELIPKIYDILLKSQINGEILVVDDNSPDGTGKVVKELQKKYPVNLLSREKKQGLGAAYRAGFQKAIEKDYDVIYEMDADFSHDPKYIPTMLDKIQQGIDLVLGSRYIKGGKRENCSFLSVMIGNTANLLIKILLNLPVHDVTTGYRAYRREVIEKINLNNVSSSGYEFQLEMLYKTYKLGFKIDQIPIVFPLRKYGESKLRIKDMMLFFKLALKLKFGRV